MPKQPRLNPVEQPQHIIQRGNNRQACFASKQDYIVYLHWLKEAASQYQVSIHAWVLMTNHVHLLATPHQEFAVSKMMQSIGRRYVQYFNTTYQRSGTLWEGRFKSCLIDSENYLLQCSRYIELNPVRANLVAAAQDYRWSSYHANALGIESSLRTPHPIYLNLASTSLERCQIYRTFFDGAQDEKFVANLRAATNRGFLIGSDRFKVQIEQLTQRRLAPKKLGRPKKN